MWNHCFHKIEDFKRIIPSLNHDFMIDFTHVRTHTHAYTQFTFYIRNSHKYCTVINLKAQERLIEYITINLFTWLFNLYHYTPQSWESKNKQYRFGKIDLQLYTIVKIQCLLWLYLDVGYMNVFLHISTILCTWHS